MTSEIIEVMKTLEGLAPAAYDAPLMVAWMMAVNSLIIGLIGFSVFSVAAYMLYVKGSAMEYGEDVFMMKVSASAAGIIAGLSLLRMLQVHLIVGLFNPKYLLAYMVVTKTLGVE